MITRFGGVGVVLVSALTAGCGLLMLGGVGPAADRVALPGDALMAPPATSTTTTSTTSTAPTTTTTTTTTIAATTTVAATSTTTTSTIATERPALLPLDVVASQQAVGGGGVVTFSGTCPTLDGAPLGPVVVWITGQRTETVTTGVTAEAWSYSWTAPVDEAEFASFTFRFWCGDPTGYDGEYPVDLVRTVDMVAAVPPATPGPPVAIIPATG